MLHDSAHHRYIWDVRSHCRHDIQIIGHRRNRLRRGNAEIAENSVCAWNHLFDSRDDFLVLINFQTL